MRELSLNVLDIVENSIKAEATLIKIGIKVEGNIMVITVDDNGKGMSKDFLQDVTSPFKTTRTTRKVGMGIPLFKMAAEITGGSFCVDSEEGVGTFVRAEFVLDSIDRAPLGDIGETITTLLTSETKTEYEFTYSVNGKVFEFKTVELKAELGDVPVDLPEVLLFVKDMIRENIYNINGGLSI